MMRRIKGFSRCGLGILASGFLALSACVPNAEGTTGAETAEAGVAAANTAEDPCGASALQNYVGQPVESYDFKANYPKLRIITHGSAVTMDFVPDRLNVSLTPTGQIKRISCG